MLRGLLREVQREQRFLSLLEAGVGICMQDMCGLLTGLAPNFATFASHLSLAVMAAPQHHLAILLQSSL